MEPKFTGRSGQHRAEGADYTANMDELLASDAFMTDLSRGVDPADGSDELTVLLLGLRDEVEAPMPPAPELSGEAAAEENPAVASLDTRREKRRKKAVFRTSPWLAGVVGAAAATVLVAGTGAALYHATPGSALWGPSEAVFGDRTSSVEFASALDEIDSKTESGDIAGARVLIDQLRDSLNQDRSERTKQDKNGAEAPVVHQKDTVTVTKAPKPEGKPKPAEPEQPATVTVTPEPVTQTVTVTETAPPSGGRETEPSSSVHTSTTSTIPTTTKQLGAPQQSEVRSSQ
ncbi:hypothetical protein [Corynebacterium appendicis]|uniref:hypothetical protein n=1 Tax=Corynebacterium appendicis TaxID=163202 RepID=UPI00254F1B2F|nr:hypothetical protein [Corynebacterium appendicis]MDK8626295.1 hypothetical protein [Corynebacterium appendicis]